MLGRCLSASGPGQHKSQHAISMVEEADMVLTKQSLIQVILGAFPEAEKILLFGSRAKGEARDDSDFDILVVTATTLRPAQRGAKLRLAMRCFDASFDLLVVTPVELKELSTMKSTAVYSALTTGEVLHEVA
jgi:predicted nucleotidyltransferase